MSSEYDFPPGFQQGFSQPLENLTPDNVGSYLDELFHQYEVRTPVLDEATAQQFKESAHTTWSWLSGSILRALQARRLEPDALTPLLQEPLSEMLPHQAAQAVQGEPLVERIATRHPSVLKLLAITPVPDEQIGPTLRNSEILTQTTDIRKRLYMDDPVDCILIDARTAMDDADATGALRQGITKSERWLVRTRYQFAREVKLLALGAALMQEPELHFDENGVATLANGTFISVIPGKESLANSLLNPATWQRRSELHDRVHLVKTTAGNFIMKEHKGGRHIWTLDNPDIPQANSVQEMAIARDFESEPVRDGDIMVSWEKAICCVRDPSGFEFVMFEYEEGLISREDIYARLAACITENRPAYETEFEAINSSITTGEAVEWDTFVTAKVLLLRQHAREYLRKSALEKGYVDDDNMSRAMPVPDHEYRIHVTEEGTIQLEIIGMDYEHFTKPEDDYYQLLKGAFNKMINNRPINTAPPFVQGPEPTVLAVMERIVTHMRLQGKRHLPKKIL